MTSPSLALLLAAVGVCFFVGGALLVLALTGASMRCGIRGHLPGQVWTSHDAGSAGYCCPRCARLWSPECL